jgi:hypothetical protein
MPNMAIEPRECHGSIDCPRQQDAYQEGEKNRGYVRVKYGEVAVHCLLSM